MLGEDGPAAYADGDIDDRSEWQQCATSYQCDAVGNTRQRVLPSGRTDSDHHRAVGDAASCERVSDNAADFDTRLTAGASTERFR